MLSVGHMNGMCPKIYQIVSSPTARPQQDVLDADIITIFQDESATCRFGINGVESGLGTVPEI